MTEFLLLSSVPNLFSSAGTAKRPYYHRSVPKTRRPAVNAPHTLVAIESWHLMARDFTEFSPFFLLLIFFFTGSRVAGGGRPEHASSDAADAKRKCNAPAFSLLMTRMTLSLSLSLSLFLFLSPPQLRCTSSRFSRFFHWIKNTLTSLLFVLREFPSYEFGDEAVINHRARFSLLVPGETKELPAATSYPIPVNQFRLNSLNSLDWAHLFGWLSNRVEC